MFTWWWFLTGCPKITLLEDVFDSSIGQLFHLLVKVFSSIFRGKVKAFTWNSVMLEERRTEGFFLCETDGHQDPIERLDYLRLLLNNKFMPSFIWSLTCLLTVRLLVSWPMVQTGSFDRLTPSVVFNCNAVFPPAPAKTIPKTAAALDGEIMTFSTLPTFLTAPCRCISRINNLVFNVP